MKEARNYCHKTSQERSQEPPKTQNEVWSKRKMATPTTLTTKTAKRLKW
jgi:hypothetical protein